MSNFEFLAPYVRSFFEDHLTCRCGVSHNTIQSYRDGLKLLLRFAAQQVKRPATKLRVTDFTEALVTDFLAELEQARGNSIQTRNHRLVGIRSLFEYIASQEPRFLDHCRKVVAIPRKRGAQLPEIHYLEKEHIAAILNAVSKDSAVGRRDYSMLLFMYNTGARVQEVADARLSWVTLHPPYKVELLGKGRKWRTCPIWDCTARHLRQLIEERRPRLSQDDHLFLNRFGRPFSRSGIANVVRRYAAKAAETTPGLMSRKTTPHTIRHTTAMHLLQSGVEVNVIRAWLGHVSISTTNRYIEIDMAMKTKALETCQVKEDPNQSASWRSDPDILAWLESL